MNIKELKKLNERGAREQMVREHEPSAEKKNLINLGIKEYIQGNYVKAKEHFNNVLAIDPNDEKAQNSIKKINKKLEDLNIDG